MLGENANIFLRYFAASITWDLVFERFIKSTTVACSDTTFSGSKGRGVCVCSCEYVCGVCV